MLWSEKWGMWIDQDTRSPEEKARHEKIADEHCKKAGCHDTSAGEGK